MVQRRVKPGTCCAVLLGSQMQGMLGLQLATLMYPQLQCVEGWKGFILDGLLMRTNYRGRNAGSLYTNVIRSW